MESYALKDLTLRLFKSIFAEPEFASAPSCGLALQAYLKDCETDLDAVLDWAREHQRRITVRLVKGAYWDYETVFAQQRHWPSPVFAQKAETDASFEKLSLKLLENTDALDAAFGTHNVRSIASVLAQAERLGIERREFEFQMLYGMADPIKAAVRQLGCRLREYSPVGELLPGMAYLVRRLLENTSNEGFLANKFAKGASRDDLLNNPAQEVGSAKVGRVCPQRADDDLKLPGGALGTDAPYHFQNEPPTDFTIASEREKMAAAIRDQRQKPGRRYPIIINNKPVSTSEWLPSLNPANQKEMIGYAAQATVAEAEAALAAALAAQPKWGRTPATMLRSQARSAGSHGAWERAWKPRSSARAYADTRCCGAGWGSRSTCRRALAARTVARSASRWTWGPAGGGGRFGSRWCTGSIKRRCRAPPGAKPSRRSR